MAKPRQPSESPTLPLPPPRAASIPLEQFIEAVSVSALRSLASARAFNPQPDPPRDLKPWIWVGIVASYGDLPNFAGGPNTSPKGGG